MYKIKVDWNGSQNIFTHINNYIYFQKNISVINDVTMSHWLLDDAFITLLSNYTMALLQRKGCD